MRKKKFIALWLSHKKCPHCGGTLTSWGKKKNKNMTVNSDKCLECGKYTCSPKRYWIPITSMKKEYACYLCGRINTENEACSFCGTEKDTKPTTFCPECFSTINTPYGTDKERNVRRFKCDKCGHVHILPVTDPRKMVSMYCPNAQCQEERAHLLISSGKKRQLYKCTGCRGVKAIVNIDYMAIM